MEKILTIEDAKKEIQYNIDYYNGCIEAWKKVVRKRKKDGSNFAYLERNFENLSFRSTWSADVVEVHCWTNNRTIWIDDSIYFNTRTYEKEEFTPDTIEAKIKKRIETYEKDKADLEKGLNQIEEVLTGLAPALDNLKEVIKAGKETQTNYTIMGYIKGYVGIL